jgi:hypothetical protein
VLLQVLMAKGVKSFRRGETTRVVFNAKLR